MKTAVILLYGLFSPERSDYKGYFDFLATEIKDKNIEKVILCGGFTNPRVHDKSEASTAKDYLLSIQPGFTNYILEEKSITTNQNLEFARENLSKNDEIIVYCDLIRKSKVIWISMHFLLQADIGTISKAFMDFVKDKDLYKEFSYNNLKIIGYDFPGKSRDEIIGQSYATLIDVLALYSEELNKMDVSQRKKDFGLE
ncbi:DUF218 domain-containing protein [candidate division WWE3 bacterium]|uniref:DUF218 domain-containing protein n=1 Tax=candidate division WWE3 bacterium TaxID=2053526 RepID=A0A7X9HTQ5_UNCKA|nr:DUF218 domain-containing protein [candidate division WWE3 bacterium]